MMDPSQMPLWWDNMMAGGNMMMMGGWMMGIGAAVLLISSILIARFVYLDANHRHLSNADIWGIVTFFLNVVGLILYVLLRGGYTYQGPAAPITRVAAPVKLEGLPVNSNKLPEVPMQSMKMVPSYCSTCGNVRTPGANFCIKCGTALD